MLEVACIVKKGKWPVNDDRAAVNGVVIEQGLHCAKSENACLAVVCDGVGGSKHGWKAAEIAAGYFADIHSRNVLLENIEEHVSEANSKILSVRETDREYSGMLTTIAGIYIVGDDCVTFNVGDSRVYRYRAFLYQMSTDHSQRQLQLDLGLIPAAGAESEIHRCLGGGSAKPAIVEGIGRVFDNDMYVLCTDGVWGVLNDEDFENILSQDIEISKAAELLVELAVERESDDDLSVIIIRRVDSVG